MFGCIHRLAALGDAERKVDDNPYDLVPGERIAMRIVNRGVVDDSVRKAHTVYVISVWRETRPREPWAVYRRYNEFSELNDALRRLGLNTGPFPGKKMLGVFDETFLNKRQAALGRWLDTVVQTYCALQQHDRDQLSLVKVFLTRGANEKPVGFGRKKGSSGAGAARAPTKSTKKRVSLRDFQLLKGVSCLHTSATRLLPCVVCVVCVVRVVMSLHVQPSHLLLLPAGCCWV